MYVLLYITYNNICIIYTLHKHICNIYCVYSIYIHKCMYINGVYRSRLQKLIINSSHPSMQAPLQLILLFSNKEVETI